MPEGMFDRKASRETPWLPIDWKAEMTSSGHGAIFALKEKTPPASNPLFSDKDGKHLTTSCHVKTVKSAL